MLDEGPDIVVPTETTALLGAADGAAKTNGKKYTDGEDEVDDCAVGEVVSASSSSSSDGSGSAEEDDDAGPGHQGAGAVSRGGMPELAAKMPMILMVLGIGVFLSALDQLLAVATYAKIGSDLNALNSTSWIATAYFLTLTSFQPLYGKLSDIFGRKECLLFSYAVFAAGCLACGLAQNMGQLVAARAVGGIGGGGMNSVVSILLTDIVPLRDRGVWQGYLNIIFAAGTASGAPLGGLLADSVGWRWSFLGQVPLCAAAFVAVHLALELPRKDHAHWLAKLARVDFLGAFVLIAAVFCLLLGLDGGSNRGWSHAATVAPLAASPLLFGLFVLVETRVAAHPFAPGRILFDPPLLVCFLVNLFGVAGQMPTVFFLPLLYQAVDGLSAVQSGLLLIPGSIAGVSASIAGGLVIRRTGRYYWVTVAAYAVLLLSTVPLVLFSGALANSEAGTVLAWVTTSLGAGCGITTTLIALIANARQEDAAVTIACSYLFRSLGTSLGISAQSALLQQVLRTQLAARLPGVGAGGDEAARLIEERVRRSLDYIAELEPDVAAVVRRCYQLATMAVFGSNAVCCALALAFAFFIREKRVK